MGVHEVVSNPTRVDLGADKGAPLMESLPQAIPVRVVHHKIQHTDYSHHTETALYACMLFVARSRAQKNESIDERQLEEGDE
jgi:hypothetical protein